MPNHCAFCSSNDIYIVKGDVAVCWPCWDERVCNFCKVPVLHEDCQGHDVRARKGNRFMEDKAFVNGVRFE